jgi:hypothetical protein
MCGRYKRRANRGREVESVGQSLDGVGMGKLAHTALQIGHGVHTKTAQGSKA